LRHSDPLFREDTIKGYDLVLSRELDMWEAYSPQFPFHCIAFGKTPEKAKLHFSDVLAKQIARMLESGEPIPEATHPVDDDSTFDGAKGEYDWSKDIARCKRPHHEVLDEAYSRSAEREALHADDFEED
jgi:predicted RNase H-like HicB family nuclease